MSRKKTRIIPLKKPDPPPEPASKVNWRDYYDIKLLYGYDGRSITIHAELVEKPDPNDKVHRGDKGRVLKMGKKKSVKRKGG